MSKRYFDNESKLKPGVISQELREAVGIRSDELPLWIYRMRILGYPPGWLQSATVNTLAIFDGNGEDGEINESIEAVKEYNKEALIEFPGFNTPVPNGVQEYWYELGMPPMLPTQQLKEALKTMKVSEPVPYKKAKLDNSFISLPSTSTSTSDLQSRHSSTSLSTEQTSLDESCLTPIKDKDSTNDSINNGSNDLTEDVSKSDVSKTSLNESKESERKLKLISMGSPMPASERPKRPDLDKWAVGMGDLIYFENPSTEYTGVYQNKMKGVIDKIRKKHSI